MAWIPSYQELREHPKLRKLAVLLGVPRAQAIGHLHCLWWWAFSYAPDGDLSSYDDTDIALGAEWEGDPTEFIAALHACGSADRDGFLDRDAKRLHDWHDYGGKYVEKRRTDAARKRDSRQSSTTNPVDVQQTSDGHPPDGARRGEEIREEKNNTRAETDRPAEPPRPPAAPSAQKRTPPDGFLDWWAGYPRKIGRAEAEAAFAKALKRGATLDLLVKTLTASREQWQRENRPTDKVPHAATWLNKERWRDEPEPVKPATSYETPKVIYT